LDFSTPSPFAFTDSLCMIQSSLVHVDKLVQFAHSKEEGGWLICDIPFQELSNEEKKRLLGLKEFSKSEGARTETQEQVSYQSTDFKKEEVDIAAELTERIFVGVFKLPQNYEVKVELNLE
jgi:hypothetical protein